MREGGFPLRANIFTKAFVIEQLLLGLLCENGMQDISRFMQLTAAFIKLSIGFCFNAKS
jgi:hypothetical protein